MEDKKIDDLVSMIDQFMSGNGGHINVTVDPDGNVKTEETFSKTVTTMNSMDCAAGDLACKVPTLFEGMDDDSDVLDFDINNL